MTKLYCSAVALLLASFAMAQKAPQVPPSERLPQKMTKQQLTGLEEVSGKPVQRKESHKPYPIQTKNSVLQESIIGFTEYDLQSNAGVQNRLVKTGDQMSGAFTMSLNDEPFEDRGTGYNFWDNGNWDEEPYDRLESVRVGWPSIMHTSEKEIVITHAAFSPLNMMTRDLGTGDWVESEVPTDAPEGVLWPRATAGGEDGNTVHVLGISTPVANDGVEFQGIDGAIMYYRSLDQGITWDIQDLVIPGMDSTLFLAFSGDTYSIHARGNTVAFTVMNDLADSFVMISHDNGDTWNKSLLVDFPYDMYELDSGLPETGEDWNEDGIFAEFYNSDGAGAVLVDLDEQVHVTYGDMYYMDDDLTDDNFSYFPGVNGISYWQEGWADDERTNIAYAYDIDENGQLDLDELPLYFLNLASMPSMGVNNEGDLFLTYSAVMENFSNGQNFRHIYAISSSDGGETWTTENGCDMTPDEDEDEYESVFGSLAPEVDDNLRLIYQRDFEPGLGVRGDEDPLELNDIVYLEMPVADLEECLNVSVRERTLASNDIKLYPNPSDGLVTISIGVRGQSDIRVMDLTGKLVFQQTTSNMIEQLDLKALSSGMYVLEVVQNGTSASQKLHIK
ncbi:MAG: T9SS type A sorting domain-containing protein [Flavobacteriales bacterium]